MTKGGCIFIIQLNQIQRRRFKIAVMKKIIVAISVAAFMFASAGLALASDGEKLFAKKCKSCHDLGDKKKVGPGMKGVFGRDSKEAGKLDEAGMTAWLKDPKAIFPKSKMAKLFKGKLSDKDIADLIEYMKTL